MTAIATIASQWSRWESNPPKVLARDLRRLRTCDPEVCSCGGRIRTCRALPRLVNSQVRYRLRFTPQSSVCPRCPGGVATARRPGGRFFPFAVFVKQASLLQKLNKTVGPESNRRTPRPQRGVCTHTNCPRTFVSDARCRNRTCEPTLAWSRDATSPIARAIYSCVLQFPARIRTWFSRSQNVRGTHSTAGMNSRYGVMRMRTSHPRGELARRDQRKFTETKKAPKSGITGVGAGRPTGCGQLVTRVLRRNRGWYLRARCLRPRSPTRASRLAA